MTHSNIVTVKDVVRNTGLSRPGVMLHIYRGNLEAEHVGGYLWIITPEEMARFMQARATGKYTRAKNGRKPTAEAINQ